MDIIGILDSDINMDEMLSTLKPRSAEILRLHYGLGEEKYTLKEIGQKLNITQARVRMLELDALKQLRNFKHPFRAKLEGVFCGFDKDIVEKFEKTYYRKKGIFFDEESTELDEDLKKELLTIVEEQKIRREEEDRKRKEDKEIQEIRRKYYENDYLSIDEIDFSVKTYLKLRRAGIDEFHELCRMDDEDLSHIKGLGKREINEIKEKKMDILDRKTQEEAEKREYECQEMLKITKDIKIEDMEFSNEAFQALRQKNFKTLHDLCYMSEPSIEYAFGEEIANEIIGKIQEYGGMTRADKYYEKGNLIIGEMDFSTRTRNMLMRAGIFELYELCRMDEKDLKHIEGLGQKGIKEIKEKMHSLGMKTKGEELSEENDFLVSNENKDAKKIIEEKQTEKGSEETNDTDLKTLIEKLKLAYSKLGERKAKCQELKAILHDKIGKLKYDKIQSMEKIEKIKSIIKINVELLKEIGEFDTFMEKIKVEEEKIAQKEAEERRIQEEMGKVQKDEKEIQKQEEEIKNKMHDIYQDL